VEPKYQNHWQRLLWIILGITTNAHCFAGFYLLFDKELEEEKMSNPIITIIVLLSAPFVCSNSQTITFRKPLKSQQAKQH
jgi:hypothetical protein